MSGNTSLWFPFVFIKLNSYVEHLFIYLVAICVSSLRMSIQVLCLFKKLVYLGFLAIGFYEFLGYFGWGYFDEYIYSSDKWFCKYFLLFHPADHFLYCAEVFNVVIMMQYHLSLVAWAFKVISEKSLPRPMSGSFPLCFLLGDYDFRSYI